LLAQAELVVTAQATSQPQNNFSTLFDDDSSQFLEEFHFLVKLHPT
jgi:hypothetical protein